MHSYATMLQHRLNSLSQEHGQQAETSSLTLAGEEFSITLEELRVAVEELRQQNEALAAAQVVIETERQRYQDLFEFAPDGYLVTDMVGMIREANRGAASLLNVPQQRLVGKPMAAFITQAERQDFRSRLNQLHQKVSSVQDYEVRLQPSRGQPFDAALRVAIVGDPGGKSVTFRWLLRDITARKQAEEQFLRAKLAEAAQQDLEKEIIERQRVELVLQDLAEQYRLLFENNPHPMWVYDLETLSFLAVNNAAIEHYGYSQDEFLAMTVGDIHPAEDNISVLLEKVSRATSGINRVGVWSHRKRNGTLIDVEITAHRLTFAGRQAELVLANDITERKQAEAQLLHNAFHDDLTGLPNRALFMDRLNQALERSKRRRNYQFAVLFLDLDRFKLINDSLGHRLGDQCLIAFASRLAACVRSMDTVARIGGDEFTILLEDIKDVSDAVHVSQRVQAELALPFNLGGQEVFTTGSIGIALRETGYDKPEDLLRGADIAMYRAKAQGPGRYEIFNTELHLEAVACLQMETELRRAIERQEFRVHYQPIVSLETGSIVGFEALVRWQHPRRGLVPPGEFLPVAKETGLIIPIDQWVLQEACRQTQQWQAQFPSNLPLTISVNLCSHQFRQSQLPQYINQILQETKLEPHRLELEITENMIVENDAQATTRFLQLKELGVQLSIDDFGTGYSSLGRLHCLPIDILKIDRSFVSRMGVDPGSDLQTSALIVETIITLAQKLGLAVTAEGVETAEQLAQLRELKCDYGQGYFFSRPLNAEAAEALIVSKLQ